MVEGRACPACGARNPSEADWCGQCYGRFDEPPPGGGPTPPGEPAPASERPGPPPAGSPAGLSQPPAAPGERQAVREWVCAKCGHRNDVERSDCRACGTTIFQAMTPPQDPPVSPSTAAAWSLVFPGIGHHKIGQGMLGVVLGLLAALALVFVAVLGFGMGQAGWASFLLVVVLGVWGVSALDAYHWAKGAQSEVLLRPRALSILAGFVLLVFLAGLAFGMRGAQP